LELCWFPNLPIESWMISINSDWISFVFFLLAIGFAIILSLVLARMITVPVVRLSNQAENVLDRRGLFGEHFKEVKSGDEIGDLSRSLKKLSLRLEKKISFIDSMAADLVHELKNPVSSVRTSTELALTADSPDREIFLERVNTELNRMDRLLDRLREISRIGAELEGEERISIDLVTFINVIMDHYRSRHQLIFSYDRDDIYFTINPDRMTQILTNLIDNALSFSPDSENVDLRLDEVENRIVFSIMDRGPGISPGSEKVIFNRFYSDRKEKGNHSGLGLAIVNEIVEGYEGTLTASNREGGGAVFKVEFPL
jgi:two-component system sensor histidine kinase ChvG